MSVSAKICGLKTENSIETAIKHGASFIGFVFFPASPRNITPELAADLSKKIPVNVKKVAVVVDADDNLLKQIAEKLKPDFLQLHGNETVERTAEIKNKFGIKIIKAFKIRSADDVAASGKYLNVADMFLFDAKAPENSVLPGGNGLQFDWNILKNRNFNLPWLLSGGINAENVEQAVAITGAKIVDVSSSVETFPGEKKPELIKEFLRSVNEIK